MKNNPKSPTLLEQQLEKNILVMDGAMGTEIQLLGLKEEDYRGERFSDHHLDLKGNNELLSLTRPEVSRKIHLDYLNAGADIIETNTFTANGVSQADYDLAALAYELNFVSAKLARDAADEVQATTPDQPRFVAGTIGPTTRHPSTDLEPYGPPPTLGITSWGSRALGQLPPIIMSSVRFGLYSGSLSQEDYQGMRTF